MTERIRPYEPRDLDRLYEICHRTGAAGEDATGMVSDRKLFGHLYAAPYGVLEPEHALVLDDGDGTAIGYVLSAFHRSTFESRCEQDWWPPLREQYPKDAGETGLDRLLIAMLHTPHLGEPDVVERYPSHLHIDLLPEAQGRGWGRRMMAAMEDLLSADGSRGLHFGTSVRNERALAFYRHLGYAELSSNDFGVDFSRSLTPR